MDPVKQRGLNQWLVRYLVTTPYGHLKNTQGQRRSNAGGCECESESGSKQQAVLGDPLRVKWQGHKGGVACISSSKGFPLCDKARSGTQCVICRINGLSPCLYKPQFPRTPLTVRHLSAGPLCPTLKGLTRQFFLRHVSPPPTTTPTHNERPPLSRTSPFLRPIHKQIAVLFASHSHNSQLSTPSLCDTDVLHTFLYSTVLLVEWIRADLLVAPLWRVGAAGYSLLFSAFIGEGRFLRKEGLIPNI